MSSCYGQRLWNAVARGDTEARIDCFIWYNNADVDYSDTDGWTSLMEATHQGRCSVIELLLQNGATVNKQNRRGETALFVAAEQGKINAIEILMGRGGDINMTDNDGLTPLCAAAMQGRLDVVELLARLRVSGLNKPNNFGITPIRAAATNGHIETVCSLVKLIAEASGKAFASRTLHSALAFLDDKCNTKCDHSASVRFKEGLYIYIYIYFS